MAAAAASIPCAILGSSRYLQVGCLSLGDEGSSLRPSRIPRLRPRRTRQWTRARTRPDHGASEARRSSGDAPEDSPEDSPERRTSFAFGVLAGCCVAMTALLVTCEWALRVTGASARDLQLDAFARLAGPLSSLVWWAGIFSVVYLTQGGFVDPIRADMIRALSGEPLGVEVLGADLRTATFEDVERMVDAMHRTGRGVLVVRDQHLAPTDCERACAMLAPHFVAQQPYTRWPGQSKPIPGCPHLALLGNYRAREDNEFGMDVVKGEVIGEYKPAKQNLEEWHTDGSFLPNPKVAIALYAPQLDDALPPEGG